jgi:hypothetical protein
MYIVRRLGVGAIGMIYWIGNYSGSTDNCDAHKLPGMASHTSPNKRRFFNYRISRPERQLNHCSQSAISFRMWGANFNGVDIRKLNQSCSCWTVCCDLRYHVSAILVGNPTVRLSKGFHSFSSLRACHHHSLGSASCFMPLHSEVGALGWAVIRPISPL